MVQLVFVHGVATRSTDSYDIEVENRDRLFREVLFEGIHLDIYAPRWGDLVPPINAGVFAGAAGIGAYGGSGSSGALGSGLGGADDVGGAEVSDLARHDATAALDAIYATLINQADETDSVLADEDVTAFKAATAAIENEMNAPALPDTASDDELVMHLEAAAPGSYGIGSTIKAAVASVADQIRNGASTLVFNSVRNDINPMVARFLGDIFVYLKAGALRDSIRARVQHDILAAAEVAKASGEPLILMGHSLGGVILYDMLSSLASAGLPLDLKIDAFLTIGSQPGLFESMGLFEFKNAAGGRTPGPGCVKAWHNVFDPIDPFGFRADPMFEKVEDFAFDSCTGLVSAHTTYFKRPQFYARMRAHLHALGLA